MKTDNLEDEILKYLNEHPNASDTAAGIARWWLIGGKTSMSVVEKALERLVAEEKVTKTIAQDGSARYKRNQQE